jgi:oxygen-independent coproporphyrinogen-3 oxidase
MTEKTGLYIHIPFCVRKCNYCAFLSFDAETSPRKEYTDALVNEITYRGNELGHPEIDTVYVGGGTPSVLDISQMRDIMHAVNKSFRVKEGAEITIEANPATLGRKDGVTLAKLQAYRFMGFNRLSMGVQAMDNDRLHYMGRIHTAENVVRDMELIRRKGFDNVNLDLMFSIPGETTEDALSDLRRILELDPEHISCYSLQIEEGTLFGDMAEAGELTEVPDEEDRRTYHEICRILKEAGYEHYEISNFAKPGFRSRHNSLYWDMSDYIGVGLGASGFTGGRRYKNISDIEAYIKTFAVLPEEGGRIEIPLEEDHLNSSFDNISEAVFTGLRRAEGISYGEATDAYARCAEGPPAENPQDAFWRIFAEAKEEAEDYAKRGLLIIDDEGLRLTEKGIDISNQIMSLFV